MSLASAGIIETLRIMVSRFLSSSLLVIKILRLGSNLESRLCGVTLLCVVRLYRGSVNSRTSYVQEFENTRTLSSQAYVCVVRFYRDGS